jgi:hypothetical protein
LLQFLASAAAFWSLVLIAVLAAFAIFIRFVFRVLCFSLFSSKRYPKLI